MSSTTNVAEQPQLREVFVLREAAEYLRISERALWQMAKDGNVKHFRVGKQIRFRLADLRRLGQAD